MPDSNKYFKKPWSEKEVRRIYDTLAMSAYGSVEEAYIYEIWVDDLKIIARTTNLEKFYGFMKFIDHDHTREVDIRIFHGKGYVYDSHLLELNPEQPPKEISPAETLASAPVHSDLLMKLALSEQKHTMEREIQNRDIEIRDLKRDIGTLEKEHAELLDYADTLEDQVKGIKNYNVGPFHLGELGSVMLESYIKRNPQLLGGLPGMASAPNTPTPPMQADPLSGASFEPLSETSLPAQWEMAISEALEILDPEQANKLLLLLIQLSKQPDHINAIIEIL